MATDERIGSVSIGVEGDFSKLEQDFSAATQKAKENADAMAAAITSALANVKPPDMSGVIEAIGRTTEAVQKSAEQATQSMQSLQQSLQQAGQTAQTASGGIGSFAEELLKLGGISLTIEGLFNLGKAAIQASDQLDDAAFALQKLTGDAEASKKTLEGLRALSNDEGLSFPVLVDAGQRLTALLPAGTDVVGVLEHIGNAAELMHTSIDTASNKFIRLAESGSASVKSLADLGIRFEDLDAAMRTLGVSSDLLAEGAQKAFKALDEHDRIVVLQEAMTRLDGVAKQMNDDIGGDSVRLMNQWHDTLVQLGDAIGPVARQALPALAEGLKAVVAAGGVIVTGLKIAIEAIIGLGTAAMSASTGIQTAMDAIVQGRFKDAATALKDGFSSASAAAKSSWDSVVADTKAGADFLDKIYSTQVPASIKRTTDGLDGLGKGAKDASDKVGASFEAAAKAVDAFDAKVQAGGSSSALQRAFENASKSIDILAKQDLPAAIKAVDDYTAAQERNGAKASVIMEAFEKESALIKKLANEDLPAASAAELKLIDTLGQGATPLGVWQKALSDEEAILSKLAREDLAAAEAGWNRLIAALEKAGAPASVIKNALEDHVKFLDQVAKSAATAEAAFIKLAQSYSDVNTKGHDATQVFKDAADAIEKLGGFAAKLPQPISDGNRAMIDFGVSAGKAKTAVEDLKTPIEQLTTDMGNLIAKARDSGDWSTILTALDNFDKRINTISKTDLPEAVKELQAMIREMQNAGAPVELVRGQFEKLGGMVEKMAQEQLPGWQSAWKDYLSGLEQFPPISAKIVENLGLQIEKQAAVVHGLIDQKAAYGDILAAQSTLLQEEIAYAEKTGQDANNLVLGLDKVKLKQEELKLSTHGLADEYVHMIDDVLKGFDQMAGAMAGAIVDGKNVGEALVGVFKNIAKSILTDVIQAALLPLKIALVELISGLLPGMSAGLSIVGGGLTGLNVSAGAAATGLKALAAAAQEAAAEIQASSATAAGGGTGGGGMASTIGAIGAVVAAGAAVASAILLGHISSDTGHIEVNTREAVAELQNLRKDTWDQFNQMYDRIGEIMNAAYSIRDAVQQFNAAGGGIGQRAQDDLDSMAADMQFLRNVSSSALMGGLSTIAQDIVNYGERIMTDLDVIVQRLGQLVTNGLTANASMADIASEADIASAAGAIGEAISDGSDQTSGDLTAMAGSIGSAIIDSGNHVATITDSRLQQAISVAQQQYAAAHDASAQLNALRAEYQANQNAMEQAERNYEQALRDGNQELAAEYKSSADRYQQALVNLQGQITPLLSAEVTYTRDAALAVGQLASTLPKEISGVGFAATGAGNLVAAHVDAAAVTIGTAVIAQGAFMSAAANAILSAAASMGHAGSGSVYGGGPGGSSGTPTTGPGSPGYGQSQAPAGPTTSTGGFGGAVNKPATNAPGAPSSNTPGPTTPYKGSTGAYVSDPNAIPMFQTGGMVTQSGMAIVEADEIVIPPAKKGDTFDQISGNNTKSDQQMAYEKLVDQVQSQMAWIAQAIGNHAPPAMMEILNKQLETYQKALLQFEMQTQMASQTAQNTASLPTLKPQPVGTAGVPLPDMSPSGFPPLKPQPVGTSGHPLPGGQEFPSISTAGASALSAAQIIGSPEYIAALAAAAAALSQSNASPTSPTTFDSPAWIQAQQAAGQAASAVAGTSNIPTVGLPSGPTLDSQTLGFYAATDAELEDIRTTMHSARDLISSMRDSWVAFQVTSHNDSIIVGQAIIDAIGGKEANPMKSFDLGGSVGMDMIAQLHAGEEVLAPDISSTLRRMLSTPSGVFSHPNPAEGTRGSVRIINITAPITINGAKGGRANAEEFVEHLKRIVPDSNGYSS